MEKLKKKDILKRYKRQKIISNILLVLLSLNIAILLNIAFIDNGLSRAIKTNVLESSNLEETNGDLYIENIGEKYFVKIGQDIKNVKDISFSLVYNPENIDLNDIKTNGDYNLNVIGETPGVKTIFINFDKETNLDKNNSVVEFNITKKQEKTENINIINGTFIDNMGDTYELSSSGFIF